MSSFQVSPTLKQTRFSNIRWVSETGSTNADLVHLIAASLDEAKNAALVGSHTTPETVHATISVSEPRPYVRGADFQTAGRGRQGRSWVAPPGSSVLMSVALPLYGPHFIPQQNWSWLTPALSLAVQTAINSLIADVGVTSQRAMLKWPNDIVITDEQAPHGYKKLAGVLAELIADPVHPWAVVGVGINTNWPEIPSELRDTTTSVNVFTNGEVDRGEFVGRILSSLDADWLPLLEANSTVPHSTTRVNDFRDLYIENLLTVGQRVRVDTATVSYEATAVSIHEDGRLVVERDTGDREMISAADVVHLRPVQQ